MITITNSKVKKALSKVKKALKELDYTITAEGDGDSVYSITKGIIISFFNEEEPKTFIKYLLKDITVYGR